VFLNSRIVARAFASFIKPLQTFRLRLVSSGSDSFDWGTYATVQDLLDELVNARVWIGFHFRHSVTAGENLGTSVANWELQRYFLPQGNGQG
jgi:hypothetical protein